MPNEAPVPSPLEGLPIWVNDANQVWPTLRIAKSIPLSRLEWLWTSRATSIRDSSTSARAVFEVSSAKTPLIPESRKLPHDWYRNPYVFTLITTLHELETVKEPAWARIRRFVEGCKDNLYEYLIILAATDEELAKQKRSAEKLRAEVNLTARGRERLVIVPPAAIREEQRPITHLHHSPAHQDLLVRLRECAREGAESRVQAYEEEVSRCYLNRTSTSWKFTQFFALKEGMAFVFVQLGRRDLAVRFYDELQVTMTERNECGTGTFCDEAAADAAVGVADPEAKDYRSRLVANSITEIDLRTYLFSRQLLLLLTDRKFSDVAERGLKFITALARRCAEETINGDGTISAIFRDTWVFTTARTLAAALTPAIPSPSEAGHAISVQLGTPRERHTARLIAGFHVHALKAFLGLAHVALPGCLADEDPHDTRDKTEFAEEARSTSNERLCSALSDPQKAEVLHSEIANAAASLYEMGGRARGAAALDGDAGMVRLRNNSYSEAESLLSAQCSRFINDNGWDDLHKRQRLGLARAEKNLDRIQEYLVSCLAMLYMSRSGRQLWNRPTQSTEERRSNADEAAYWVSETVTVAGRLSRVMKYKAERLFEVSVLPNARVWLEGDPGSAVVRISSDIPARIQLDSIMMECQCMNSGVGVAQKSALRFGEGIGTQQGEDESSAASDSNIISGGSGPSEQSDVVVLRSEESVDLVSGINDVVVRVNEIPRNGRYQVTMVALFLGNLKLVQGASKGSLTPIVTTKGPTPNRNASLSASPTALSDYVKGDVRFPMFYASEREPSVQIAVEAPGSLHLAPRSVQFVPVKITAGQYGLQKGSKLSCSLLSLHRFRSGTAIFVHFCGANTKSDKYQSMPSVMKIRRLARDSVRHFDHGEAILNQSLHGGEVFEAYLAVQMSSDCTLFQDRSPGGESETRSCFLQLQLSCVERDSTTGRTFVCKTQTKLTFVSPIVATARIELNCEWGGENVSRALGLDGTPLGDGGTLLCSIRNATQPERPVSVIKATLKPPQWLELRPDEPPAHVSLLPCTLRNSTMFTFAFDLQLRLEATNQHQYGTEDSQRTDAVFDKDAVERRLSRAIAESSHMAESHDDISGWGLGRRRQSQKELRNNEPPQDGDVSEINDGMARLGIEASTVGNLGGPVNETEEDTKLFFRNADGDPRIIGENEEVGLDDSMELVGAEEEYSVNLKEADDVVDLSVTQSHIVQSVQSHVAAPVGSNSLATLQVDLEIEGMDSVTCVERKICMDAMRRVEKRYRVERSIKRVGECGREMELQFAVRTTSSGRIGSSAVDVGYHEVHSGDIAEVLQYEIDADPTVWMVVGRRRGRLAVSSGLTTVGSAKIIPLSSGRQRVPCVRLFTEDGGGLALSRYENVNEYMQVAVTPQATIVSACSLGCDSEGSARNNGGQGKGKMPVVIASDSFFGN